MVGAKPGTSCRRLFKEIEILLVPCQCIFSLMNFIVNNRKNFQTTSPVHCINTRNKLHPRRPNANLSCFQKCEYLAGIKIFSTLPLSVTSLLDNKAQIKVALRRCKYTIHLLC